MSRPRAGAERYGHRAEAIALWYLRLKGYQLLAQRFKAPVGEIDLIMRRGGTTAFIEVKARATIDQGIVAVTPQQSKRIARAAAFYMARHDDVARSYCRFDIIVVPSYLWPKHIENAFEGVR